MDLPMDFDSLKKAGAIIGSGGLVVMDEDTCMVSIAQFFMNFICNESCGKCTPCREGTTRMLDILTRITKGNGKPGDIEELRSLAKMIQNSTLCCPRSQTSRTNTASISSTRSAAPAAAAA